MSEAGRNMEVMLQPETIKQIVAILKTNVRAASSLGHCYVTQLGKLFLDLLTVYKYYSEAISNIIATQVNENTSFRSID